MLTSLLLAGAALQPTGTWQVESEATACVLAHRFGELALGFRPVYNDPFVELFVIVPGAAELPRVGTARIGFGTASATNASFYVIREGTTRSVLRVMLPLVLLDALRGARALSIELPAQRYDFVLPPSGKALATLTTCQQDLLSELQLSEPNTGDAGSAPPRGTRARAGQIGHYFDASNYPSEARDRGEEGRVMANLLIDPRGKIVDCRIMSTAAALLAQRTCAIARRYIVMTPAKDDAGKPRYATYRLNVNWQLPG